MLRTAGAWRPCLARGKLHTHAPFARFLGGSPDGAPERFTPADGAFFAPPFVPPPFDAALPFPLDPLPLDPFPLVFDFPPPRCSLSGPSSSESDAPEL